MRVFSLRIRWPWFIGLSLFWFCLTAAAMADDDDIRQTVARLSYLSGDISLCRGDSPDDWQPMALNAPMAQGDRLYTAGESKLELQLPGGNLILLNSRTDLATLQLTEDTKQFSIGVGTATFYLRRLGDQEYIEVATPNVSITLEDVGEYRFDVDDDGNSMVTVRRGYARAAAGGQEVTLADNVCVRFDGMDSPVYEFEQLPPRDGWDRWVMGRENRFQRGQSYHYVHPDVVGSADLDDYGHWVDLPDYGLVWTPEAVADDWQPYRMGHWIWQDPWGWTWVGEEPWGWAPYHYGRWVFVSAHWYWYPDGPGARFIHYSPALVAFTGGGPGWSMSLTITGNGCYIGWFPLGPREPLFPWWGRRQTTVINITNFTYINKTYCTVVNHNTFVSGGFVNNNIIRDRMVIREVSAAPVIRGAVPVVPTPGAIRVSTRSDVRVAGRPSEKVMGRSVVTRTTPPPPPPTFASKMEVIRRNEGAPVSATTARETVERERRTYRSLPPTRSATSSGQAITPSSRRTSVETPQPQPMSTTSPGRIRRIGNRGNQENTQPVGTSETKPASSGESRSGETKRDTSGIRVISRDRVITPPPSSGSETTKAQEPPPPPPPPSNRTIRSRGGQEQPTDRTGSSDQTPPTTNRGTRGTTSPAKVQEGTVSPPPPSPQPSDRGIRGRGEQSSRTGEVSKPATTPNQTQTAPPTGESRVVRETPPTKPVQEVVRSGETRSNEGKGENKNKDKVEKEKDKGEKEKDKGKTDRER